MSHRRGKSDCCVVPKKLPNKAAGEAPAAAEAVEGRRQAKGNAIAARMSRRSVRVYDMGTALDGIRQTAKGRRDAKFTGLLHHIYAVERLKAAYLALKRDAAAGVDGQTWQTYGQDLEGNLLELSERLARGGYRPQPVKRVYIDTADGSKRALGVPALEDKLVQRAIPEQGQYLRAVVTGHARYFGVPCNGARLRTFRHQVVGLWHRTLCRRSQSRGLTWRRMYRLMAHWLPVPNICHPYPNQRLIVMTQGRSRMR
jgi:hypothetical protein